MAIPTATDPLFASNGWRIEVTGSGKYWQWRRGSGKKRESRYGGKFDELGIERKKQYAKNRKSHARSVA
jgi:hypothetical protein